LRHACLAVQPPPTGLSAAGAVVIVVSIILAALIAVLLWLWNKIRGLRLDPNAYRSLTGGTEGEAGGIYDD
jgi:type IV secretory pathway VirB3-like protein